MPGMERNRKDGPITIKSFPDALKDLMQEEIATQRETYGPLTSYGAIIQDALLKRYADARSRKQADDKRVTKRILEESNTTEAEDFL